MSYDIYGNLLQKGHCEVHPWVHHEYPCPVCRDEKSKRDARQQGPSTIDFQESHIEALRTKLAAKEELVKELVTGLTEIHKFVCNSQSMGQITLSEERSKAMQLYEVLISKASGHETKQKP